MTKFDLNSFRNNGITMKLQLQTLLAVTIRRMSEMTSYSNNGNDIMNCFAKFEKFLRHSILMLRFISESRVPPPPSYILCCQNCHTYLGKGVLMKIDQNWPKIEKCPQGRILHQKLWKYSK